MVKRATPLRDILKRQKSKGYEWTDEDYRKRRNIRDHDGIQGRGWVPGGYKYLGPGNDMNLGEPTNANDAAAQRHDEEYGKLQEQGINPYTTYNDADEAFIEQVQVNDIPSAVAKAVFRTKRAGAKLGIIKDQTRKIKKKKDKEADDLITWALRGMKENYDMFKEDRDVAGPIEKPEEPMDIEQEESKQEENSLELPTDIDTSLDEALPDEDSQTLFNLLGPEQVEEMEASKEPRDHEEQDIRPMADVSMAGDAIGLKGETPITIPPTINYGFSNTHTCILPHTGWISWSAGEPGTSVATPSLLKLRMNQPYAWLTTVPAIGNMSPNTQPLAQGFYNGKLHFMGHGANNATSFPVYFNNTDAERAQWFNTFRTLYQHYAVIGCEWEILATCPTGKGSGALLMHAYDMYKTAGANEIPTGKVYDMISWPGIQKTRVSGNDDGEQRFTTLRGRFKRGMIKQDVLNDGDFKTWTSTGSIGGNDLGFPSIIEELKIWVTEDPMNTYVKAPIDNTYGAPLTGINFQITMKWVVQFKDLRTQARYPHDSGDNALNLSLLLGNERNPTTNNSQYARWGST